MSGERWTNDGAVSGTPSDTFQPPIVCQSSDSGRVNPEFPQSLISDGSVVEVWGVGEHVSKSLTRILPAFGKEEMREVTTDV